MATQSGDIASADSDSSENGTLSLTEAFQVYVQQMPEEAKQVAQPEIAKFVRWLGGDRLIDSIAASEIGEYSEMQVQRATSSDAQERLSTVKTFLTYLKKSGSVETNLAQHLRIRKSRTTANRAGATRVTQQQVRLTKAGFDQMTKQLAQLNEQRQEIALEIQKAAADGDVRENAPLEAARENQGMVMAKIREIEGTLKLAVVIDGSRAATGIVHIGSKVEIIDTKSKKKFNYQLVEPNESNPLTGKISIASPVGAAILGQSQGSEVTVSTPRGKQQFKIETTS